MQSIQDKTYMHILICILFGLANDNKVVTALEEVSCWSWTPIPETPAHVCHSSLMLHLQFFLVKAIRNLSSCGWIN